MHLRTLVVVMLLFSNVYGQKRSMSPEEALVRNTYAKLTFAAQLGMLWHAIELDKGWPSLNDGLTLTKSMNEQIRFDLSGFQFGDLTRAGGISWNALVEGPVDALLINHIEMPVRYKRGDKEDMFYITYADVAWKPRSSVDVSEDRASSPLVPTVKDVLKTLRKPNSGGEWARYVSYSVVASLRERSISYRAAFLFSRNGKEVLPLDYATAMGLAPFVKTNMYPSALVDTAFRELPFAESWILANEIKGCKKSDQPEVCCDAAAGRCGIASEDLQRSLNTPVDPAMRSFLQSRLPKEK